jgi:hypothetical protein
MVNEKMPKQVEWRTLSLMWSSDIGAKPKMAIKTKRITNTMRMRIRILNAGMRRGMMGFARREIETLLGRKRDLCHTGIFMQAGQKFILLIFGGLNNTNRSFIYFIFTQLISKCGQSTLECL